MRILVLTPTFLPVVGGAELVILEVYRRLAPRHAVRVLTPHLEADLLRQHGAGDYDELINFEVSRYRDRASLMRVRGHRVTGGLIPPFSLSAVGALGQEARAFRPDVLNVHYVMPTGLAAAVASLAWRIPTVLTFNGRDVPGPHTPPLWRYWHRAVAAAVHEVTFVSDFCRLAIFGRPARGEVIFDGVTLPAEWGRLDSGPLLRRHGLPHKGRLVFALQRLNPEKRVDVLLEAMGNVVRTHADVALILGGQGPLRAALEGRVRDLGLQGHVAFAGYIPRRDLGEYFRSATLFALHSTFETFGMVLAEAMSYGRPVVSIRSTAIPEVVADGECGLLVPPGEPVALAEGICRLLDDPALCRKLGEAGRDRAQALFDWDQIALRYEAALARAAGRRGKRRG